MKCHLYSKFKSSIILKVLFLSRFSISLPWSTVHKKSLKPESSRNHRIIHLAVDPIHVPTSFCISRQVSADADTPTAGSSALLDHWLDRRRCVCSRIRTRHRTSTASRKLTVRRRGGRRVDGGPATFDSPWPHVPCPSGSGRPIGSGRGDRPAVAAATNNGRPVT